MPPQKRRRNLIFKVNLQDLVYSFLPEAPTQSQVPYFCKKVRGLGRGRYSQTLLHGAKINDWVPPGGRLPGYAPDNTGELEKCYHPYWDERWVKKFPKFTLPQRLLHSNPFSTLLISTRTYFNQISQNSPIFSSFKMRIRPWFLNY